jgi:hypothetical protein
MSKTLLEKLKAARAALALALGELNKGGTHLATLERDRNSIASQVEQLEAATEKSPDDADAVARLSTLRDQQRLYDRKIAKVQSEQFRDMDQCQRELGNAADAANELVTQCAQPLLDGILSEARTALAPFYADPARLELVVQRNEKLLSLKAYLGNAGSGGALPMNEKPQRLIRIIDRLITGGPLPWTWQGLAAPAAPEPTPAPPAPAAPARTARRQSVLA